MLWQTVAEGHAETLMKRLFKVKVDVLLDALSYRLAD